MNKLKFLILFFAALLIGCEKFLEVQPQGKVLPKTDSEFAALLHNHINDVEGGDDMCIIGNFENIITYESFADNLDANVKVGTIAAYAGEKINKLQTEYKDYFEIIRDCNIIIENLTSRETDLAKKTCATAFAIKGICYYNLIRTYCEPIGANNSKLGIPIIEKFDMEEMPERASIDETITYCEKMLTKAIEYNITDDFFLITKDITKAYLAKLYFWAQKWDECITICNELMQIQAYKLASIGEYPAMIQSKNGSGQEVIVRSHINNNSDIDWYYSYMLREVKSRPVNYQLIKLFGDEKETDVRYSLSFDSKRINLKNTSSKVRGSELVLMLAESYYHKKEYDKALEQINYLRSNRISNAKIYTINNLPELDSNSVIKEDCTGEPISKLLSLILNERRKELYMEGDRWFELKRNGRPELWIISNGLKYTTYKYLYTAPIYKGDIDINSKLIQNEGYIY